MLVLVALAAASLAAWVVLAAGRGLFWVTRPRLGASPPPDRWPSVTVVVPARDEAGVLTDALPTVLAQQYPGEARVVFVDDQSTDGTGELARALAARPAALPCTVLRAPDRPSGWAGKLWALDHGLAQAGNPDWVLLTDADIAHAPGSLAALVSMAEARDLDYVSLMARLRASSGWERLLVPAFVYFFAMLYPFRWVGRRSPRHAAAAGGCVLARASALRAAGGVAAVHDAVIDDVALAQAVARAGGRTWLGFADDVTSVRPYDGLSPLWHMVARSAFTQLRHSATALAGTVVGLALIFLVPPAVLAAGLITGSGLAAGLAGAAWLLMTVTYLPMQRYYRLGWWRATTLPVAAALYLAMTVDSARRHWTGRGAAWKGRQYRPVQS